MPASGPLARSPGQSHTATAEYWAIVNPASCASWINRTHWTTLGSYRRRPLARPGAAACHVNIQTPRFTWTYDAERHIAELLETPTSAPRDDGVTGGLFGALSLEGMLAAADQHAEAERDADDTVAGRPAYVLIITPNETPDQRMRFWIDQEHFIVVRADALAADGAVLSSVGYIQLEFNPTLDAQP